MQRRTVLLGAPLLLMRGAQVAVAQSIDQPDPTQLIELVQSDLAFTRMQRDMWVLRELLIISEGPEGDRLRDSDKFANLQNLLDKDRALLGSRVKENPTAATLSAKMVETAGQIVNRLEKIGIARDNEVMRVLIKSYYQFNQLQIVATGVVDEICGCYPFSAFCST